MSIEERVRKLNEWGKSLSPRWWRILRITWLRRGKSSANTMAAAIGFYALVCIGPLGLLAASVLQLLVGPGDRAYEWLQNAVTRMAGETAGAVMVEVDALLTNPGAHIAGFFSFIVLIWGGLRLFESVAISLTEIWPQSEGRGLIARKLVALVSMVAAGGLFVVAILLTALLPTVMRMIGEYTVIDVGGIVFLQPGFRLLIEVAVAFAAFFLLFKFVPAQEVQSRVAAVGALFTALAWRAVTPIFTLTVARSAEQSTVYGGLTGVVMFLFWAFFGAHVLLFGAHLAAAYEHVVIRGSSAALDESFIRSRPAPEEVAQEDEEDEDGATFHGPRRYPPPGRV